ncbi:MAG: hypothetical protein R3E95_12750 [Thiolinea sp.]
MGLGCVFIGGIRNDLAVAADLLNCRSMCFRLWHVLMVDQDTEVTRLPVGGDSYQDRYDAERVPADVVAYDAAMQDYYQCCPATRKAPTGRTNCQRCAKEKAARAYSDLATRFQPLLSQHQGCRSGIRRNQLATQTGVPLPPRHFRTSAGTRKP